MTARPCPLPSQAVDDDPGPLLGSSPRLGDVAAIALCTVPALLALVVVDPAGAGWGYLSAAAVAVALRWRRRFPLAVLLVTVALAALNPVVFAFPSVAVMEGSVGLFTLATIARLPVVVAGYAGSEALVFAVSAALMAAGLRESLPVVFLQPWSLIALALGWAVRERRRRRAALVELMLERGARAVAAERARITAEMHDVVSHSLTVMIALAGGARTGWQTHPERARQALEHLSEVGSQALADMQRILQVLGEEDPATGAAPALERSGHDLPELDELVEVFRAAGLPVHLETPEQGPPTDSALRNTVHRIVQEALTNALRYACTASRVEVRVRQMDRSLEVTVTDDARPDRSTRSHGAGVGLESMRARAEAFGGTLEAGPRQGPTGLGATGWQVRALIPLTMKENQ